MNVLCTLLGFDESATVLKLPRKHHTKQELCANEALREKGGRTELSMEELSAMIRQGLWYKHAEGYSEILEGLGLAMCVIKLL